MMKKLVIPEDDSASSDIGGLSMQLDKQCSINLGAYRDFTQTTTSTTATTTFSAGAEALIKYKDTKNQPAGGYMGKGKGKDSGPEWHWGHCGTDWWIGRRGRWWQRDEHGTFVFAKCGNCDKIVEYAGCTYKSEGAF